MQVEVDVLMMADCRDNRRMIQNEILSRFEGTCLSYSLNIPGTVKDKAAYRKAFRQGLELLNSIVGRNILYALVRFLNTGPEAFLSVQLKSDDLKKITVEIEERHPLGRLFDMDILDSPGKPISRSELGLPPRLCLICDNPAPVCARNRSHNVDELLKRINSITADI